MVMGEERNAGRHSLNFVFGRQFLWQPISKLSNLAARVKMIFHRDLCTVQLLCKGTCVMLRVSMTKTLQEFVLEVERRSLRR